MSAIRLTFNRELSYDASTTTAANYTVIGSSYSMTVSAVTRRGARMVDLTVSEANTGHIYTVTVSNLTDTNGKPIKSDSVTATIIGVGTAPQVSSASQVDNTHVDVVFDEEVDSTTAEDVSHYAISGTASPAVSAASLDGDGVTVHLTLGTSMPTGNYNVAVIHVTDVLDNVVDPSHDDAAFSAIYVIDWVQNVTATTPDARTYCTLAYDSARGVIVMFGGLKAGAIRTDETWEYDGTDWTQKFPAHSPAARYMHSMCYDSNRGVCVMHGGDSGPFVNDTWEWDGIDWTHKVPGGSIPWASGASFSAFDSARNVVVVFYPGRPWATSEYDGTNWTEYNPATNPTGSAECNLSYDEDRGVIVLFGGDLVDATYEWGGGPVWTLKTPTHKPPARYGHAMCFDSSGDKAYIFGGTSGIPMFSDTWEYEGTDWTQTTLAHSPSARWKASMAYDSARGKLVLFGGSAGGDETWELG